jgi:allophanate hydrolase
MGDDDTILMAVVGAHLTGQPLNGQLTERGGRLIRTCRTAPEYRLYALKGTVPPKPGLERVVDGTGHAIEVEVWALPIEMFGSFMKLVSSPLGIGTLHLDDGTQVKGFICEPFALATAKDISYLGGWRNYLAGIGGAFSC